MGRISKSRTKTCSVCKITKTIKSWYANSVCSNCHTKATPREVRRQYEKTYTKNNPEKLRAKWNRKYQNNKEKCKARMRAYRQDNLEKLREYDRERWKLPERKSAMREYIDLNRERVREVDRQEYRRNKSKHYARVNSRRAHMGKATPKWVSLDHIATIYENCPEGYHVDHIVPIKAKIIYPWGIAEASGLHVPWNLQYLPASENLKKRNRIAS